MELNEYLSLRVFVKKRNNDDCETMLGMSLAQVSVQHARVITVTAIINQALRVTAVSGLGSRVDGGAVW